MPQGGYSETAPAHLVDVDQVLELIDAAVRKAPS
jgi:hypothetical protein